MDRQLWSRSAALTHELEDLAAQVRAGNGPSAAELDRHVESALECLIEGKMRLRALAASGEDPAAPLRAELDRLAQALADVRMARTGGELLTHGFVMPRPARRG